MSRKSMQEQVERINIVLIRDVLYNTHPDSGSDCSYARGCVVGVVAALMAVGLTFDQAIKVLKAGLPEGRRQDCIPGTWADIIPDDHLQAGAARREN